MVGVGGCATNEHILTSDRERTDKEKRGKKERKNKRGGEGGGVRKVVSNFSRTCAQVRAIALESEKYTK